MVNIYIITPNGSGFTDEGLNELKAIVRKHGDNRNIAYNMGSEYHKASYLSEELKATKEKYIALHVISKEDRSKGSLLLIHEGFELICEALDEEPDANSWDVIYDLFYGD